jgi:hypothetical protein
MIYADFGRIAVGLSSRKCQLRPDKHSLIRRASGAPRQSSHPTGSHRFQFHKGSQLFIRTHNETLSITAMRVSNEDYSSASIYG